MPRSPLVLDRTQRQTERAVGARELAEHRLHDVHVGLGVVRVARLEGRGADRAPSHARHADVLLREAILGEAREVPLDLEADDELDLLPRKPRELALE